MVDNFAGLKISIGYALDWLENQRVRVTPCLADNAVRYGIKTIDYFLRVLMTWVSDLHSGAVQEAEFVDRLADLIDQQLTRAFHEGMRANGLDPIKDMTDELSAMLQNIIANEYKYVDQFAADIVAGRGGSVTPFQQRAQLWANRYRDVVARAKILSSLNEARFIWRYGDTIEHCATCSTLAGVVATAKDWKELFSRGIFPRSYDLACHGFHCDCDVDETQEPLTKGGIPL